MVKAVVDVLLIKPPLLQIPSILTRFRGDQPGVKAWQLQKKAFIDPTVGNCWPGDNLSIGYLAAFLRERGLEVRTIDSFLADMGIDQVLDEAIRMSPRVVGVSVLQAEAPTAVELTMGLRRRGYQGHIVLGGHFPTFAYEELLGGGFGIDSVAVGEGEYTLLELVEALRAGSSLDAVAGLAYARHGKTRYTGPRTSVDDLDSLPFPSRDWGYAAVAKGYVSSVSTSRGCDWARCAFCCIHSFNKAGGHPPWRGRSPERVVEELRTLGSANLRINFVDENFLPAGRERERATAVAEAFRSAGIELEFLISARVPAIDPDVFRLLRDVGLRKVFLGVESGVDRLLRAYGKGFTADEAIAAVRTLRELGLTVFAGAIFFSPLATFDEVVQNIEYFRKMESLLGYFDLFRYSRRLQVYVGTPLHRRLLREGVVGPSIWSTDYRLTDARVGSLYASIVRFQELAYPFYAHLGKCWEGYSTSPGIESLVWAFADQFHAFLRRAINVTCKAMARDEPRLVDAQPELARIEQLAGSVFAEAMDLPS